MEKMKDSKKMDRHQIQVDQKYSPYMEVSRLWSFWLTCKLQSRLAITILSMWFYSSSCNSKSHHCLYLSEQTNIIVPNTLIIATCEVFKPWVSATEHITQFNEEVGYLSVK
jgi:hypothetical protein